MKLTRDEACLLCVSIMEQAVRDYLFLITNHKESAIENRLRYSLEEIREFFNGEWCEWMVEDALHFRRLRGTEILKAIDPTTE